MLKGESFVRALPVNQVKSAKANGSAGGGASPPAGSAANAPALETHRASRTANLGNDVVTGHSSGDAAARAIAVPRAGPYQALRRCLNQVCKTQPDPPPGHALRKAPTDR